MNSKIKKFITYTTSCAIISAGVYIKICQDRSYKNGERIERYIYDFVDDNYDVVAHRGFSSLDVENTLPAIKRANNSSFVDYIEMDIRLTKDNKLVLSHNNGVSLSNGKVIRISDVNYDFIKSHKFKYDKHSLYTIGTNLFNYDDGFIITKRTISLDNQLYDIPTLTEGLDASDNKKVLIDIKFNNDKEIIAKQLFKELENRDCSNIIIQSLDIESLNYLKEKNPNYTYLALIGKSKDFKYINDYDNIGINKKFINHPEFRKYLERDHGIVAIWTLNTKGDIDNIVYSLGDKSDDILYITDYPDNTTYYLNNKSKKLVN